MVGVAGLKNNKNYVVNNMLSVFGKISTSGMLKYVGAAAVAGGACLVGGQLLRLMPKDALPELNVAANEMLQTDMELHSLMHRLRVYSRFDRDAYRAILENVVLLLALSQRASSGRGLRLSQPRKAAERISGVINNIRVLRAITSKRVGGLKVMEDFDDIAGGVQTACTNAQHNITMNTQYALSNR